MIEEDSSLAGWNIVSAQEWVEGRHKCRIGIPAARVPLGQPETIHPMVSHLAPCFLNIFENDADPHGTTLSLWDRLIIRPARASDRHIGASRRPEWRADTGSRLSPGRRVTSPCLCNRLLWNVNMRCHRPKVVPWDADPFLIPTSGRLGNINGNARRRVRPSFHKYRTGGSSIFPKKSGSEGHDITSK